MNSNVFKSDEIESGLENLTFYESLAGSGDCETVYLKEEEINEFLEKYLKENPGCEIEHRYIKPETTDYTQEVEIRWLRPDTPPELPPIIIREEAPIPSVEEKPLRIVEVGPIAPKTPPPIIIREAPPTSFKQQVATDPTIIYVPPQKSTFTERLETKGEQKLSEVLKEIKIEKETKISQNKQENENNLFDWSSFDESLKKYSEQQHSQQQVQKQYKEEFSHSMRTYNESQVFQSQIKEDQLEIQMEQQKKQEELIKQEILKNLQIAEEKRIRELKQQQIEYEEKLRVQELIQKHKQQQQEELLRQEIQRRLKLEEEQKIQQMKLQQLEELRKQELIRFQRYEEEHKKKQIFEEQKPVELKINVDERVKQQSKVVNLNIQQQLYEERLKRQQEERKRQSSQSSNVTKSEQEYLNKNAYFVGEIKNDEKFAEKQKIVLPVTVVTKSESTVQPVNQQTINQSYDYAFYDTYTTKSIKESLSNSNLNSIGLTKVDEKHAFKPYKTPSNTNLNNYKSTSSSNLTYLKTSN